MPANLPPQYSKAEDELRHAATPEERLEKLREMFRLLPKHKGTEKLQSDLKQKLSRCRDEIEHGKAGKKKAGPSFRILHEGAGQIVLVGAPNTGKSALLAALTNAHPEVAAYPFTTRLPQPGMMSWEDVHVQLVDLPPITTDFLEPWCTSVIRSADAAALVVDLGDDDLIEAADSLRSRLDAQHTELVGTLPYDVEDESIRHIRTLVIANKCEVPGAADRLGVFREYIGEAMPIVPTSTLTGDGLEVVRGSLYNLLGLIRVYTKAPGRPAERTSPYTLPQGSTILDLARAVHRDLEQDLKFARIWGRGVFDGQAVKRDHELHDSDMVEIHA